MSSFVIRPGLAADNSAIQRLLGETQPAAGVRFAFERAPDYFLSADVMYSQSRLRVAERRSDGAVLGLFNLGMRQVYVDGEARQIPYAADMRIAGECQGSRLLVYVSRAVRELVGEGWYQSVILEDNQRSRQVFEGGRAGMPQYRPLGRLCTYTVTACRRRLSTLPLPRVATPADIPAMNRLVRRLAAAYQFLPAYDFNDLLLGSRHFAGLSLDDFLVLPAEDGELRGMAGLWNQKAFKQTRVVDYSRTIALLRPFYNWCSRWWGGFQLPARGQTVNYLSLHSPLTQPEDQDGFRALLQAAWQQTRQRGYAALALTLAAEDPRNAVLTDFRSVPLRATHYTVAYDPAHQPQLDNTRIPYFECGRL